jgi:sporulation protein YlmC with PRC-barrel domain
VWAVLELLDRQLVDRNGRLVGKVDDVELTEDADALPCVNALLSGLGALAGHLGGDLGRALAALERRLAKEPERVSSRIDFALVCELGSSILLAADREELDTDRAERWTRDVVIDKIPGAGDAAE